MIVDVTGTILTLGNHAKDCLGNRLHPLFPCCCDECDYMLCCMENHNPLRCSTCKDNRCPNTKPVQKTNILFAFFAKILLRASFMCAILKVANK